MDPEPHGLGWLHRTSWTSIINHVANTSKLPYFCLTHAVYISCSSDSSYFELNCYKFIWMYVHTLYTCMLQSSKTLHISVPNCFIKLNAKVYKKWISNVLVCVGGLPPLVAHLRKQKLKINSNFNSKLYFNMRQVSPTWPNHSLIIINTRLIT